ncbi:hypothetical protein HMI54_007979, partial [Coelomomyces lativittatus]
MEESEYASDFETFSDNAEIHLAPPPPPLSLLPSELPQGVKEKIKKKPKSILKTTRALPLKKNKNKNLQNKVKENKPLPLAPELKEHFLGRIRQLEDTNHDQKNKIKQLTKEIKTLQMLQKRQEKALSKKESEEAQWQSIINYLTQEVHSLRLQPHRDSLPSSRFKHELE